MKQVPKHIALLFLCVGTVSGGDLQLISELKLDTSVSNAAPQTVVALSVAPNEQRFALCIMRSDRMQLVIFDGNKQISSDNSTRDSCSKRLFWSPDGDILLTETRDGISVRHINNGSSCHVSNELDSDRQVALGFVSPSNFIVASGLLPQGGPKVVTKTKVIVYDANCGKGKSWVVDGQVNGGVASYFVGRVAMNRAFDVIAYLNTESGQQKNLQTRYHPFFTDRGRILCLAAAIGRQGIECLLEDGTKIMHKSGALGLISAALDAPLLVALENNYSFNPFTEVEKSSPKRWLILDIGKLKPIAILPARLQNNRSASNSMTGTIFAAAISPSGRLFLIAGDGAVLIYKVNIAENDRKKL